jgi:hypothetical protein
MKILLATNFLEGYTGSESFIYTLGKELKNLGHDVKFYCNAFGWFGHKMREEGFTVYHNELPDTEYDVVHFQHNEVVTKIYPLVPKAKKVFMSHGILPPLEQALPYEKYPMDGYLGCSEETLDNCLFKAMPIAGATKNGILRNLIDTKKYFTDRPIHTKLENVLIISNYIGRTPQYIGLIAQACSKIGANLKIIGDAGIRVPDTRVFIPEADLVIGLGRCILEAMSMCRSVLVFDYQGMEGLIDSKDTYEQLKTCNFSGRKKKQVNVNIGMVMNEFSKYKREQGNFNRELILKNHHFKEIALEAESFYSSL